jgi:hypothetical protein
MSYQTFPLLSGVFSGNTLQSKRIDFIKTGASCEASVFSNSKLAPFVSSMVITLLHNSNTSSTNVHPRLTKYVLSLLQKTHISSSTILLSLLYCHRLSQSIRFRRFTSKVELFKCYTTSLVLADCFLNDNAFSSKSWSTVTGLSKLEISAMKRTMLHSMNYDLHAGVEEYTTFLGMLEKHLQLKVIRSLSGKEKLQEKLHREIREGSKSIHNSGYCRPAIA